MPWLSQVFLHGLKLLFVHEIKQTEFLEGALGEGYESSGKRICTALLASECLEHLLSESVTFEERELVIII